MNSNLLRGGARSDVVATAIDELRRLAGPLFAAIERLGMSVTITAARLPDNPIVFVSAGFLTLTGYSADEVLGRNCRMLQGDGTDPAALQEIRAAIAAARRIEKRILNYRKDGAAFWNNLSITPVMDASGAPAFYLATQVDVTAEDQAASAEQALKINQRRLEEVNERLRIVLSISGAAAAWEWHVGEKRISGDAGFAALYALRSEDAAQGVSPTTFFSIVHPEDRDRIRLAVGGMLRGAEVFSKEYRLLLADGSLRWVHARGRTHYDEDGQPARFSGVLVDITEQKRVQEQLRIAQTAGGIGTFEYIDGFGTATVSDQFCSLLGLYPSHVLPVRTINTVVHPGDGPIIDLTARPVPGFAAAAELRIVRPDTRQVRWLMRRGEYLRDAETAGIRFSGVIYDITDAKRVEEQLRTLNETLETRVEERTRERDRIWRVSRDLYVLCGADGRCLSANPAWESELGYSREEIAGRRLVDFVHADDRRIMEKILSRIEAGEQVQDFDIRMMSRSGDHRWISWTCVPEGSTFFAAGRDVTQRNQLEEQLRQSHKMEAVGQLTGGLAHDFNNMLTGITASIDMIRRRLGQGRLEDAERFLDAAMTSAQRAASLTHRLLAFARRQSLDVKALDVNDLVRSMADLIRRTLGEQIQLVVDGDANLWPAFSDANQLESALLNLAINARDAMPDGGSLTISTANISVQEGDALAVQDLTPGDYVAVSVRDTGVGMSPETVSKAFDPFFTTKPIGKGTGLGLSMIYGFAKQSGGHARIESNIGQGATVHLYLPRFAGDLAAAPADSPADFLPNAEGESVLVVEDDPAVRMLILELLQELGYETAEAIDGPSALAILQSPCKLDLMVSDVGLPGMNGRQLAEQARLHRPEIKILLITGYAENATVRSDFLLEGMDLILKPFAIDVLATKIRGMLV
jgi:PAS domain S-box-containing protein